MGIEQNREKPKTQAGPAQLPKEGTVPQRQLSGLDKEVKRLQEEYGHQSLI